MDKRQHSCICYRCFYILGRPYTIRHNQTISTHDHQKALSSQIRVIILQGKPDMLIEQIQTS